MKYYKLDHWLNKNFKNTECKDFLNSLMDNNQIIELIKWTDASYTVNKYGAQINYEINLENNSDITIDINYLSKKYHIELKECGSKFLFFDTTNLSKTKNMTKATTIKVFKDKAYYLDVKNYDNYNQTNQKLKHHTNLKFSNEGALLSYIDEDINYKKNNHQYNSTTRPRQFKKENKKHYTGI